MRVGWSTRQHQIHIRSTDAVCEGKAAQAVVVRSVHVRSEREMPALDDHLFRPNPWNTDGGCDEPVESLATA